MKNFQIIILVLTFLSCTEEKRQILDYTLTREESSIYFFPVDDSTYSIDIFNWQDSLPDSTYTKRIINIAVMENSNVKLRQGFLQKLESFSISESKLGNDTLFLDSSFKNLDYLCLIHPKCAVINLDSVRIRKLYYTALKERDYNFTLDLNKIQGLDTLTIQSPEEYIKIPINKNYKCILPCTKNNQVEELRKYYEHVYPWSCYY
ncbi:hypothetical protein V9L05_05940 [Bernardetia sp. Wsw4-3y2]|uniref:hypothetical protein n=1 Tax=Bernardetia sp. Wsw4-3y2 TaxID=3127471 RepID=UPI0030CBC4D5